MNYHNITKDDMLNGEGLRVTLWVSGCDHNCKGCHNPQTHNPCSGIPFTDESMLELLNQLNNDYISGLTLSGGDPLYKDNLTDVLNICETIRDIYGKSKNIWLYSGYKISDVLEDKDLSEDNKIRRHIISLCDVFIDGKFELELKDDTLHWVGSSNQRIIKINH